MLYTARIRRISSAKSPAESFLQWYGKDYGMDTIVLRLTGVHGFGALMIP